MSAVSRVMCQGTNSGRKGGRGRKSEKAPGALMIIQEDGFLLSLFQQAPSIPPI